MLARLHSFLSFYHGDVGGSHEERHDPAKNRHGNISGKRNGATLFSPQLVGIDEAEAKISVR